MLKMNMQGDNIFIIRGFLTDKKCDELIQRAELIGFEEASVMTESGKKKMMKGVRNNDKIDIEDSNLAHELYQDLIDHLPISDLEPDSLNPRIRFYKYSNNQRFARHKDEIFEVGNLISGYTFLIYLSDNFIGGETNFYRNKGVEDISIPPEKGTALLFDKSLGHKGENVPEGVKYVLRSDVFYRKSN